MNKRPQESHPAEEADDRHGKKRAPNATTTGPSKETPSYDTKETFRIRDIPESYSVEELCKVLQVTLKMESREIIIHSLSTEPGFTSQEQTRTATVSFRRIPSFFAGRGQMLNLDTSQVASTCSLLLLHDSKSELQDVVVTIDQHFLGFTPLSPARLDSHSIIDCIVIHGFGGHAVGSFRDSATNFLWIRDSLPHHYPGLRVFTYGYDSNIRDRDSVADIYEWSQNFVMDLQILRRKALSHRNKRSPVPILFIVHSLGGYIFKEAFISMHDRKNPEDEAIRLSTHGALFFGVPSQGMDISLLTAMAGNSPRQYTVQLLDRDVGSRLRQRQHEKFCNAFPFRNSKIVQFFELLKTNFNGKSELLLDPGSATYGRPWETGTSYTYSIGGDHRGMIKFARSDRETYERVRYVLSEMVQDAVSVVADRMKSQQNTAETSQPDMPHRSAPTKKTKFPITLPPFLGSKNIVGRNETIAALIQHVKDQTDKMPCFALFGEGGVGKTQAALKYIDEQHQNYDTVLWVNADTMEKLTRDYEVLAIKLGCLDQSSGSSETSKEALKTWLQNNSGWLLVFDNADNFEVLDSFWPARIGGGHILLTSRQPAISDAPFLTFSREIKCSSDEEGASMLLSKIKNYSHDVKAAKMISSRLGGLPLAISHIASYIKKNLVSLEDFISQYDGEERVVIEEHQAVSATWGYQRSFATCWKMSMDSLSTQAQDLLNRLALLDSDGIPIDLIMPSTKQPMHIFAREKLAQKRALLELVDSSLIHFARKDMSLQEDQTTILIHRLVQDACRRRWSPAKWQESFKIACDSISRTYPKQKMGQSMVKFYPQCITYSSHVLTLLRHLKNNPDKMEASLGLAEVLAHCGWYHFERGQFDTAFSILERAKFICNQVMPDEKNLIVALVYNNLGGVYVSWSKREEAEVCIKTCIQHREACLTRDDPQIQELATVYSNYANLLRKEELHWEESRLYYEKALDIRKTCPGCTPELLEHTLFNYANWFLQQGLVEDGFSYLLEAKELHSLFERISTNQLYTMYTIGKVEYIRGHTMKSYETHKECLNHRVRLEGENHFLTGVSLHKVGCLALKLGNMDECILYLQRALKVFRNTTGDRGLLPRTLIQLGRILTVKGNQDLDQETQEAGEAMLSEGTELAKQHRGRNVPLETEADINRLVKTTYQ